MMVSEQKVFPNTAAYLFSLETQSFVILADLPMGMG